MPGAQMMRYGLVGLSDGDRPGRVPVYGHDDVLLMVKTVTEPPPDQATRWTMEALALRLNEYGVGISASQVWRMFTVTRTAPILKSWLTAMVEVVVLKSRIGRATVPEENV